MILKKYAAFLFLEDGMICQGWSFSESIMSIGEVVFNTGITGYQEVITDPSYCDQIVLFTYPEIGNTGINIKDTESANSYVQGVIAKNICIAPSSWRSQKSFVDYLIDKNIPHLFGVDTRFITKHIRDYGVMLGCISSRKFHFCTIKEKFSHFNRLQSFHLVHKVTTKKSYVYQWDSQEIYPIRYFKHKVVDRNKYLHVVVIDLGVKFNILRRLSFHGCKVTVLPALTSYTMIMSYSPDGVVLSNGPGDPSLLGFPNNLILKLLEVNIPLLGICLGHQLLSLAVGGQTSKLKFGHRGLNHPSGLHNSIRMTSQNHGFVVSTNTLPDSSIDVIDWNLNDTTIAGIVHRKKPCFSVQYHPEASPGPHDSDYLFEHFINIMRKCKFNG